MTSSSHSSGVAIIGVACRFPGAADHRSFWRNLCNGVESITSLSDDELAAAGIPTQQLSDPSYVKAAPILPEIDMFDAAFFEYSPKEAVLMDPQQRILLEVAWEAFEDAGYRPGGPVGVFVGAGGVVSSYLVDRLPFSAELPGDTGGLAHIANDKDFLSTRISYKLNLTGPSINVQTACSTSLVAVHLACQAIFAGECDMALAGASTIRVPQRAGYLCVKGGILSPDGHCRAFDADARGTIFGSGVGVVLLKDLAAAVADRDNIYAVIRGSSVNNDGANKVSYTASSVPGQAKAMVEAIGVAGISPDDIAYVECHGTGTVVGDPLEVDALSRAFRTRTNKCGFCAIGSVKTNVGHLEQAAGVAALIKTALALKNGKIPPSLNYRTPNPKIDFAASPFFVNVECREWPKGNRPRLAAVNSLGLGGTNAFAILEEAPSLAGVEPPNDPPLQLFTVSAKSESALRASVERQRVQLDPNPEAPLADICFTSNSGRAHFARRFCAVAGSTEQLQRALAEGAKTLQSASSTPRDGVKRQLAFLFSGQASQYVGMGAELYRHQPAFRAVIDRCAELLRDRQEQPLLDVLFGGGSAASLIDQTVYTQPALFAIQAALTDLWRSWGITPDVVLGHSVGEFAAACCAGTYTLEEGLALIAERARLMQALPRHGVMAAISATEAEVAAAIANHRSEDIAIAAVNGPRSVVVSGKREAVDGVVAFFEAAGVSCQPLNVSHAFHSPLVRPAVDGFECFAAAVSARAPEIPWISTVSGALMTRPPDAQYWRNHALGAVRFADGMKLLADMDVTDFMEIGPGNTLLALGRQCVGTNDAQTWLASLNKHRGDWSGLLSSLGRLYERGYEIDWDGFNRPYRRRRVSLPGYPFERRRFWMDDGASRRTPERSSLDSGLTGARIRSAVPDVQFEAIYSLDRFNYLNDHRIYGLAVLPMTVGLAVLRELARQHFETDAVTVANLQYREALVLPETGDRIVQWILTPVDGATAEFRLASIGTKQDDAWRTHMVGMVRAGSSGRGPGAADVQLEQVRLRCSAVIPTDEFYAKVGELGLAYGPSFRGIESMWRGAGEVLTHVLLPAHLKNSGGLGLHPALLDACLHVYPALIEGLDEVEHEAKPLRPTYLPIGVEHFSGSSDELGEVWVRAARRLGQDDGETVTIDIDAYRDDGSWVAAIEGLSLRRLPPDKLTPRPSPAKTDYLYQMRWDERPPLPASQARVAGDPASWLILGDRGGVGSALAGALNQRGEICRVIHLDDPVATASGQTWRSCAGDLRKHLAALIAELTDQSKSRLRGVVGLWALDFETGTLPLNQLEETQELVVGGALTLFQTVIEARAHDVASPRIWLATRNVISVSPNDPPAETVSAALWGLARSAALEHPQIWGGIIDLGAAPGILPSRDASAIMREIIQGDGEDQLALRSDRRFAARLVRMASAPAIQNKFNPEGSYLITGGLGALAVEVAKWMVTRRGVKYLVLVSRRGDQDPAATAVQNELAALGADIKIFSLDITKERDVRTLLSEIEKSGHPLKGVFHCAGLLDDGILSQMDWEKVRRVTAPKVIGAWLLSELTHDLHLDHFVLFSSILSLTGSAGQANYAAANAFLDVLVERRRRLGLPALALNWGPWAKSGLATKSGEKGRAMWHARGTEYISTETGLQALEATVGGDLSHAAITVTQWPIFLQQFTTAPRLYDELGGKTGVPPRFAEVGAEVATIRSRLRGAPKVERRRLLVEFVRQQAMKTLGVTESIDTTQPLRELGLDSLMSVTLVNRLEAALDIRISTVKLIQGPSIERLVDDIVPDLTDTEDEFVSEPIADAPRTTDGRWLVVVGPRTAPRVRLFCFPFAGGGSAVYRNWAQSLKPAIEVIAIEPPGRLSRIDEEPVTDIDDFVDKLVSEMQSMLDRPFAFFGHCLGGLTMFETARRLIHSTQLQPCHLFASGARPPDRINDQGPFEERMMRDLLKLAEFRINLPSFAQPDDVFAELLRHFNIRATEQLLDDPELRQLMLPVIRAEFKMASDYEFISERPWEIPITCFAARGDPYVSRRHALVWGRFTNSRLQVHMREGAHFAVVDDAAFIHNVINRELLN